MKSLLLAILLTSFAWAQDRVIYGEDDRRDWYEFPSIVEKQMSSGLAIIVQKSKLIKNQSSDSYTLSGSSYGQVFKLCRQERFFNQPVGGFCTSFLIDRNKVLTAGHCVNEKTCPSIKFVFDYQINDDRKISYQIADAQIYGCKKVIYQSKDETSDIAYIELDRDVRSDRYLFQLSSEPLQLRDSLFVMGFPSGLPLKLSGGAEVRELFETFFKANLDTFGGSSGSPVFKDGSSDVVGLLVRGEDDFQLSSQKTCFETKKCENDQCQGEDSISSLEIRKRIQRD